MNPVLFQLLITVIAWILGFTGKEILERISNTKDPEKHSKRSVIQRWMSAFVSIALSLTAANSIRAVMIIDKWDNMETNSHNNYTVAKEWIEKQNSSTQDLFELKLDKINDDLKQISNGEFNISREELFSFWRFGFENLKKGDVVRATNMIPPPEWDYFSNGGMGKTVQTEAIKKNININRIMILSKDSIVRKGLMGLAKSNCEDGVIVKTIGADYLEKEPNIQQLRFELGTDDFVIFSDKYLLLTFVNPINYNIKYSKITTDINKIKKANELYDWLWNNSTPCEYNKKQK